MKKVMLLTSAYGIGVVIAQALAPKEVAIAVIEDITEITGDRSLATGIVKALKEGKQVSVVAINPTGKFKLAELKGYLTGLGIESHIIKETTTLPEYEKWFFTQSTLKETSMPVLGNKVTKSDIPDAFIALLNAVEEQE